MVSSGRIVVAYAGVHEAYQLALAAQEMGELQAFYCSLYDAPDSWGARLGGFVGPAYFEGRRAEGLDTDRTVEFPWPLVWKAARDRVYPRGQGDWTLVNAAFDLWVAQRLRRSPPQLFVGTASSDLYCLEAAKRRGTILVHDCPGVHPQVQARLLREAAERAGVKQRRPRAVRRTPDRKLREYPLADVLAVSSDFSRRSFKACGYAAEQIFVSPLWTDPNLWRRADPAYPNVDRPHRPLKLLFVGSINLGKGIPFLLEAVARCGAAVELTVVGPLPVRWDFPRPPERSNVTFLGARAKADLRAIYEAHDVLALPSVCDAFGFVALEAMACGLPVILTDNCGAPTPDASWRVPAMDCQSLAERIMHYSDDRTRIAEDGLIGAAFAAGFTPQHYRGRMQTLFADLLDGRAGRHRTPASRRLDRELAQP